MQLISSQMYPELIDIINEKCSHRVESIVSAELDGNNDIVCHAQGRDRKFMVIIEDENDLINFIDLSPK